VLAAIVEGRSCDLLSERHISEQPSR